MPPSLKIFCLALLLLLAGCATTATTTPAPAQSPDKFETARQAYAAGNFDRAFVLMRAEAELGNAEAQYAVGYMYLHGKGTEPSREQGLAWIKKAAAQGNQKAVEALARIAESNTRQ